MGTGIEASENDVTVYVNGTAKTVTLSGENAGAFSIETPANETYARAEIKQDNNNELIITPVAAGETSVTVIEGNGGKTLTINITVLGTTIVADPQNVTAYVGGSNQTVALGGENSGTFTIETEPEATVVTASISGNILTIKPVGVGSTSVTVKELNGNKTTTVNVEVKETSIDANNKDVTLYVGGAKGTVTITGTELGTLSIEKAPDGSYATAEINPDNNKELIITPVGAGSTNVVVKEGNGNKTVTIKITVLATSITPQSVELYAGGTAKTVTIQGLNMGTLTIENGPDTTKATASISGTSLTVTPAAAGTTSLTLKEANGNKTATISITVLATSIEATPNSLSVNVSDGVQTVQLSGTNAGTFSIVTGPNSAVATAQISGSTLTITPVGKGETSVVVKEGNGNKQTTISITVSAEVSAPNVPATDYGAIVNGYDCTNSAAVNNWLLFYADDNNIYLIADDYIPYANIPNSSGGHKPNQGAYPRAAYFNNILNDYSGSSSIIDPKIQSLNNDYFTKGYSSTNNNMKAVAYMLDTNAWSIYAGEYAEYAVGGPSIEMLMASYSEKCGVDYRARANSNIGYQTSKDGGLSWKATQGEMLSRSDETYVIKSTSNAYGYWVTSPSDTFLDQIMYVGYDGDVVDNSYYGSSYGFRPIVCLKSNIKLEKNPDGSYTIVEPPKNNNINPTTDYGAIVNGYESEYSDVVGWRIFYADTENTYLIADDYIPYENIPTNSSGNKLTKGNYTRGAYFSPTLMDNYSGSESITDPDIKSLNNDYFTKNYSSSDYNMKAVAYMLDTNAWKGFAGDKAEYAVGGPSIEILMASYSEKYEVDYRTRAWGTTGYQISNNGGVSWESEINGMLNSGDRTYVINDTNNAIGMWVASPCMNSNDYLFFIYNVGKVASADYGYYGITDGGFRPLVCLKSDTQLVKNSDGSYTIL